MTKTKVERYHCRTCAMIKFDNETKKYICIRDCSKHSPKTNACIHYEERGIPVKIKLTGGFIPVKATDGAACFDVYAPKTVVVAGHAPTLVSLGIQMAMPPNLCCVIKARSGFQLKGYLDIDGIRHTMCDTKDGIIDSDYRGDVCVIIWNFSDEFVLKEGERFAQIKFEYVPNVELVRVNRLPGTERGEGGFGSTGSR